VPWEKLVQRLAVDSLVDGFIEEGLAADRARMGADLAVDPAIRREAIESSRRRTRRSSVETESLLEHGRLSDDRTALLARRAHERAVGAWLTSVTMGRSDPT
jgi:hypothetical protein